MGAYTRVQCWLARVNARVRGDARASLAIVPRPMAVGDDGHLSFGRGTHGASYRDRIAEGESPRPRPLSTPVQRARARSVRAPHTSTPPSFLCPRSERAAHGRVRERTGCLLSLIYCARGFQWSAAARRRYQLSRRIFTAARC